MNLARQPNTLNAFPKSNLTNQWTIEDERSKTNEMGLIQ